MALFSRKPSKAAPGKAIVKTVRKEDGRLAHVLKRPHFSEKALLGTENGCYVFEVSPEATKLDVAAAIEKFYKVKPRQVRMAHLPGKKVSLRTRRGEGTRARRHKAYVYLKKGDVIQFA
jgi:large subunit ribosomal protein L23